MRFARRRRSLLNAPHVPTCSGSDNPKNLLLAGLLSMRMLLLFALLQAAGAATVSYVGSLNPNDPNDLFQVQIDLLMLSPIRVQSLGYGGGTNAAGVVIPGGGFDTY